MTTSDLPRDCDPVPAEETKAAAGWGGRWGGSWSEKGLPWFQRLCIVVVPLSFHFKWLCEDVMSETLAALLRP